MKTTIDAMKRLQQCMTDVLRDPQNITRKMMDEMTRLIGDTLDREEAQTVEPVAWMHTYTSYPDSPDDADGFEVTSFHQNKNSPTLPNDTPLFTHPAPPPSGEREALIERSKTALNCLPDAPYKTMLAQLHADMLADDAQALAELRGV